MTDNNKNRTVPFYPGWPESSSGWSGSRFAANARRAVAWMRWLLWGTLYALVLCMPLHQSGSDRINGCEPSPLCVNGLECREVLGRPMTGSLRGCGQNGCDGLFIHGSAPGLSGVDQVAPAGGEIPAGAAI